jgi:hypothetical protein
MDRVSVIIFLFSFLLFFCMCVWKITDDDGVSYVFPPVYVSVEDHRRSWSKEVRHPEVFSELGLV